MEWGGALFLLTWPTEREGGGGHVGSNKISHHLYLELPTNISHLNDFICDPLNRKGLLCRDCLDGLDLQYLSLAMHVKTTQGIVIHSILH